MVTYDPAHADQIVVQPVLPAPSDYESDSYDCGAGKCARITWKASEDAGVTEYVIYRALANEPFYTEFARVTSGVTSYNTNEP